MIVGIATHKGGSGKTVTALNLAAGLARSGDKTLLVDLDPQGHAGLGLGIDLEYDSPNMADALIPGGEAMDGVVVTSSIPNLDVAPSNIRLATTAEGLYSRPRREERLMNALEPVQERYRWIVVDSPPNLGSLMWNIIYASDLILIPCVMGARSADGLVDLLGLVREVKNRDPYDYRILYTIVDVRTKATIEAVRIQMDPYREKTLRTVIPRVEALNQAQIVGQDIFDFAPRSKGAEAYRQLSTEIQKYAQTRSY